MRERRRSGACPFRRGPGTPHLGKPAVPTARLGPAGGWWCWGGTAAGAAWYYDDRNQSGSVLGMISDLLIDIGVRIEDQGGEDITEVIDEAAAYVQDSAGQRLERARTAPTALEAP